MFFQFGKYLARKAEEPLIDQHVLRAFGIFKAKGNETKIKYFRGLSIVTKNETNLIKEYKFWLETGLTRELRQIDEYSYHVDKVLFALGRQMKSKKIKNAYNS